MKLMKKNLLALSILTISANTLPDGFGDVIRSPFVATDKVLEGTGHIVRDTGEVITGQNPAYVNRKRNLDNQLKNDEITQQQYNQRLQKLKRKYNK